MDLPWSGLRALRELAVHGTITAAAVALGYSTGAVSQQLAALEKTVRTPLTMHIGRNVYLTDAGAVLAKRADDLLSTQDRVLQEVVETTTTTAGHVRLGIFTTATASWLSPILIMLRERYPRIKLFSREVTVEEASLIVQRGEVDIALGLDYPGAPIPRQAGTDLRVLRSEEFSLVSSQRAGLSKLMELSEAAELDWILPPGDTHFGVAVRNACRKAKFEPHAVHEVNGTASSLALVADNLGVTLATPMMMELSSHNELQLSQLTEAVERHLVLLEPVTPIRRKSVSATIEVMEDVAMMS